MTIEKAITDDDLIKAKMLADFLRRYEKAKDKGFKGSKEDFLRRIENQGLKKGGPVKPNGITTLSLEELETIDPGGWQSEEDKPMKVSFRYGATSQAEEDLIGGHVDDWNNAIIKGDLDPSTTFMQYIDMLLGRYNKGGIISVVPRFS